MIQRPRWRLLKSLAPTRQRKTSASPATGAVALFEMTFRESSEISTEFTRVELNKTSDPAPFRHDLTDIRVEEEKGFYTPVPSDL